MSRLRKRILIVGITATIVVGIALFALSEQINTVETTQVTIQTTSGEGEGEGEGTTDHMTIGTTQGRPVVDFKDPGGILFEGYASSIDFQEAGWFAYREGGWLLFGFPFFAGSGSMVFGGPAAMLNFEISTDYLQLVQSTGTSFLGGNGGLVAVGAFTDDTTEQSFTGAALMAADGEAGFNTALVHAGPNGGLTEGESETGPVVELAVFSPTGTVESPPTASVTVKGNNTDGEVTIKNASSSIQISADGNVIIQLGEDKSINNTDTLGSAPSAMAPESYTSGSAGQTSGEPRTSRLTSRAVMEAVTGSQHSF